MSILRGGISTICHLLVLWNRVTKQGNGYWVSEGEGQRVILQRSVRTCVDTALLQRIESSIVLLLFLSYSPLGAYSPDSTSVRKQVLQETPTTHKHNCPTHKLSLLNCTPHWKGLMLLGLSQTATLFYFLSCFSSTLITWLLLWFQLVSFCVACGLLRIIYR